MGTRVLIIAGWYEPVGAPVVEDQKVGADELTEQAREAAIAMGEFEFGEEAGQTSRVAGILFG